MLTKERRSIKLSLKKQKQKTSSVYRRYFRGIKEVLQFVVQRIK